MAVVDRPAPNGPAGPPPPTAGVPATRRADEGVVTTRPSRGLEEFFSYIRDQSGLTILDLGGATQQNVSFITNLGHRLYSEDFLQILNETFGARIPRTIESRAGSTISCGRRWITRRATSTAC